MFYIHAAPLGLMRIMRKKNRLDICSIRRGWGSQPVGRGNLAPTIGDLPANYGLACPSGAIHHQCLRALATEVILLLFHLHVYFFRDSERKNAPRKIPL